MFILNIKLNYKKILLLCLICASIIAAIVEFGINDNVTQTSSKIEKYDYEITDENFIDNIKKLHENIDENINKTIKISGFVYTLADFNKDFFICGRYYATNIETQVAGIMCNYDGKMTLTENEWIEVTGTIIKGEYNGNVPVIKVNTITKVPAPANMYVK